MNKWDTQWMEMMVTNGLEVKTGIRYMDDIRVFMEAIREGWRWWNGALCYCKAWKEEDLQEGLSRTARTAKVVLGMMNDVMTFLDFTTEIEDDFADRKLPTLDVKVWIRDGIIEYEFYEKPMAANTVLHAKTALSEQTKFSSLTQEVVRRLVHTSRRLEHSTRMEVLETLCQKMANSGHTLPYMSKVLKAGICSYSAKLRNSLRPPGSPNYKPLHQSTKYNSLGRWRNKVMARDTWYQGDQEEGSSTPTLFIQVE